MFAIIGLVIDIALVLTVAIYAIIGFKKGFVKSIIALFSWSFCFIVAILTAKYVANWINGIFDFAGFFGNKISNALISSNEFFSTAINSFATKEELIAAIPGNVNGLVKQIIKVVFTNSNVNMESTDSIGSVTGESLGIISVIIITGILIFVVLKLAIWLISKLLDKLTSGKVIGSLNKVLGLVFGVAQAAITIIVINFVLVGLTLIPAVNKTVTPIIMENTYVEKYVYNGTDKLFEKYLIEGDLIENWTNEMWQARKASK